ncbi:tRNA wybutosine-synthesizing protein 4 [Anolis sagrei]|uniref:tRNA wybutosine-synthesizing protein 4 n=1 Tax=Anolis sagrei TaxID=38937 RepID=UPI003520CC9B
MGRASAVRGTGSSSAQSKRSAAGRGYREDRFVELLLRAPPGGRAPRRAPAIHRGYHVRACAVEHCLRAFLRRSDGLPHRQVLSLGAGMDSLFFWAKAEGLLPRTRFFEVDFPEVMAHKAALVSRTEGLAAVAGKSPSTQDSDAVKFWGEDYRLLGADLAELTHLEEALLEGGLDPGVPTLILAEVVLTYMETERSDALIRWAAGFFPQAWFVLYEQIHPGDPFGHVMQQHFRRLRSPLRSLDRYSDCEAQRLRFLQRGWTECSAIDMNEFYRRFVPGEEQERIRALEPFDEFEEWHLKCSHYFILVSSKGEPLSLASVLSALEALPPSREPTFAGTIPASACTTEAGASGLRRFGHRSVLLALQTVLTAGGFGDQEGRHCRLTQLHLLRKRRHLPPEEQDWEGRALCLADSGDTWDGRLFHSLTLLKPGWVLVLGGRRSPASPALDACRLSVSGSPDEDLMSAELSHLPPIQGLDTPRWRHSATEVEHQGEAYLFVYGGCSSGQCVLDDWCFLHLEKMQCHKVPVEGPVPAGRHSHSACAWEGGVLIAGGLGAAEQPLGSVLFLRPVEGGFQWQMLETCPPLIPRYSHTAHAHRGKLLLVGGIWLQAPSVPGVAVVDLATGQAVEYSIDTAPLEWPLMLHGHSSVFLPKEEAVLVLGGGGNCFSFGSHLNHHPVRLSLGFLWAVR